MPHILFYYWAANIQTIYTWCNSLEVNWGVTEASSRVSSSLPALFFDSNLQCPSKYTQNPIMLSSLRIWKQFRRHFRCDRLSTLMPMCRNRLFVPPTLGSTFAQLREKGLLSF